MCGRTRGRTRPMLQVSGFTRRTAGLAARDPAGDGRGGQGQRDQGHFRRGQSAGLRGDLVQAAEQPRAQPRLHVAHDGRTAGARPHRHLQSFLLRGMSGDTGSSGISRAGEDPKEAHHKEYLARAVCGYFRDRARTCDQGHVLALLAGAITAQVTENVYDSRTGRFVLIPQGTRLIGIYDSQVAFGQSRVLLVWARLIMPNGRSIVLERQPGADRAGYSGLEDKVDNRWGALFKAALLSTLLGVGSELGSTTGTGSNSDVITALRRGSSDSLNQTGQKVVQQISTFNRRSRSGRVSGARDRQPRPRARALQELVTHMAKLKLGSITDDKPVKLAVELSAGVHRDLIAYAEVLARETGQSAIEPAKLIAPMLARFMATDRVFAKKRRTTQARSTDSG
jgi:hypothetical protein